MLDDSTASLEMAASAEIVSSDFTATVLSSGDISLHTFRQNNVIAVTISTLVAVLVAGLAIFFLIDVRNIGAVRPSRGVTAADLNKNSRSMDSFFEAVLPDIFTTAPWYERTWNKVPTVLYAISISSFSCPN
jgi:hypothetical protein